MRGPDARRKQLISKLMQQAQAQYSGGSVPVPGAASTAGLSEGRAFRNATDVRRSGALPVTQSANVLPGVLARLGVTGRSLAEEVSPGVGMAINVPRPDRVNPGPDVPFNPGNVQPQGIPAATPQLPVGSTEQPGAAPPPPEDNIPSPVPLGNGLYYDPVTDAIRGMPGGMIGGAARGLGR